MHFKHVLLPMWPGSHLNVSCPGPFERRWSQDWDAQRDWNQAPLKPSKAINMGALAQCRSKCIKLGNMLPSTEINTRSPVTPLLCVLYAQLLSHVWPFETHWTVAHQALLSMGFFRQEHRNGLPFLAPEDLPQPGIEPKSPALQELLYLPNHSLWKPLPVNWKEILKGTKKHHVKYDL